MKKLIYSLILILCMTAASASAEAAIKAKVDSENNKIIVSGTADAGADVPLMLLKPLDGATLSAANLSTYAVHIVPATADGTGAVSKELPMKAEYEGVWYTLLTESGSTGAVDSGLKLYYPNSGERDSALAAVNSATAVDMDAKLTAEYSAGVKNADILGVSITLPEYTNHKSAFCQTLFGKKPSGGWLTVAAFQSDFEATVAVYTRYLDALAAINSATRDTLTSVLTSYNDVLKLTLTGKYASYSSAINKDIVGTYSSLDSFITKFNKTVADYQPPKANINGSPGSGGSGNSGSNIAGGLVVEKTDGTVTKVFSDLDGVAWAEESILRLAKEGIVSGTGNNMFSPDSLVTREQFVKMILLALDFPVSGENASFSDVSPSDWYYSYVLAANDLGIVKGKDDGSFGTGEYVTREDMVTIALRAVNKAQLVLPQSVIIDYTDEADISDYAEESAKTLGNAGIITGMPDGSFMPKEFSTRAQAAVVLDRLMQITKG
ncbi:MAG: S-layer homology domain-containing protein [Clostridia bacterium]|nr:S-layer homology domain-containing protein [Clostridia bacterium]